MAPFFTYLASIVLLAKAIASAVLPPSSCHPKSIPLLYDLHLQCPLSPTPSLPIEINGETLERILASRRGDDVYYSVLFYSSWCPFSHDMRSKYDSLSFMFPQITHLAVEKSSAMPSVFSRYRVYRVPTVMVIKGGWRVQYEGPKMVGSVAEFYERSTGMKGRKGEGEGEGEGMEFMWEREEGKGWRDGYVVYGIIFLGMRVVLNVLPMVVERMVGMWGEWGVGVRRLGEVGLMVSKIVVDVTRLCNRITVCKKSNLQQRARSAGVWASSSLASVSLGEPSRL